MAGENGASHQDQVTPYGVHTRESDEEDASVQEGGATEWEEASTDEHRAWNESTENNEQGELREGMLLRDLPKRTTFYDPVAERQMSQTDFKHFYQRSKAETRSNTGGTRSQQTPFGSPMIAAGSQPPTEYGADSLLLDPENQSTEPQVLWNGSSETPTSVPEYNRPALDAMSPPGARIYPGMAASRAGPALPSRDAAETSQPTAPALPQSGLLGSGAFDTEPQITEELSAISKNIQRILDIRRKYIKLSAQGPDDNPRDMPGWDIYPLLRNLPGRRPGRCMARVGMNSHLGNRKRNVLLEGENRARISVKTSIWMIFCPSPATMVWLSDLMRAAYTKFSKPRKLPSLPSKSQPSGNFTWT
uniref:Uncharacterized protein n=1 Tax=Bionectria ochroleuca TaxID=29856 RepID=A0A8H7TQW3_BIOOC